MLAISTRTLFLERSLPSDVAIGLDVQFVAMASADGPDLNMLRLAYRVAFNNVTRTQGDVCGGFQVAPVIARVFFSELVQLNNLASSTLKQTHFDLAGRLAPRNIYLCSHL